MFTEFDFIDIFKEIKFLTSEWLGDVKIVSECLDMGYINNSLITCVSSEEFKKEFMQLLTEKFLIFNPETCRYLIANKIFDDDEKFKKEIFDKVRCRTKKYISKYVRYAKFADKIFCEHKNIVPIGTYVTIEQFTNENFKFIEYYIALVDYYSKVITKEENAIKKAAEVFIILFYNFVSNSINMKIKPYKFYIEFMCPMVKEENNEVLKVVLYEKAMNFLFNEILSVGIDYVYDL